MGTQVYNSLCERVPIAPGVCCVLHLMSMNQKQLLITLFGKGNEMRQQWGTKANPTEYGETKLPARLWNQLAGGVTGDNTEISSLCVEGEGATAGAAG